MMMHIVYHVDLPYIYAVLTTTNSLNTYLQNARVVRRYMYDVCSGGAALHVQFEMFGWGDVTSHGNNSLV
jgi:hypothetical protein